MPLYEYYCQPCHGIFEELRPMREATEAVPCPECYEDSDRIMPTSFAAFTFRDGYPRRIPDDGGYFHLGKKVTTRVTGGRPNEHPEINKPKPAPQPTQGEVSELVDMQEAAIKGDLVDMYNQPIEIDDVAGAVERRDVLKKGTPDRAPRHLKRTKYGKD
tara:strand:- start:10735 stop:11211 length:477 start_codon:yes stop_codon:yes gene_type:complete